LLGAAPVPASAPPSAEAPPIVQVPPVLQVQVAPAQSQSPVQGTVTESLPEHATTRASAIAAPSVVRDVMNMTLPAARHA
jgi:hypothetical protein